MPADKHVPSYTVVVDGQPVDPKIADRIKEIRVVDDLRLPDICTFNVTFPRGKEIDSQPFEIGKALEVRLGAREELAPRTLFKGQVVTVEVDFGSGGCSILVRAFDRSHLLHRSRKVRTFQNQTASDIVGNVVREAGLEAECQDSGQPYDFIQQDNESDWDFIWRLAERIGFEFIVEDTKAMFRKPTPDGGVELEYPKTLTTFKPRVTAIQQVGEVTLMAHDPRTKQVIEARASTPEQIAQIGVARDTVAHAFDDASLHVATEPVKSAAEGNALAQALLDKLANGYIAATGVAPGNPELKAGTKINVTGVGTKFSGSYRIAHSTHVLRGGGSYETHFANAPTHTLLGAVGNGSSGPDFGAGLVLGVVTNNSDDEGNMGRVRVKFPALGPDAESAWARIATPSAGEGRGLLMLPQPGEEVLVGFEHGDTTRPYVLGSLFNGVDLPGDDLLREKKGSFAVFSKAQIYLHCDEEMITEVVKDQTTKVQGKVSETYQQSWTNDTSQDTTLNAMNIELSAKSGVTIKANTTLTLQCGASKVEISAAGVTVSGPMVSIG